MGSHAQPGQRGSRVREGAQFLSRRSHSLKEWNRALSGGPGSPPVIMSCSVNIGRGHTELSSLCKPL